jgi:hypothetical protein
MDMYTVSSFFAMINKETVNIPVWVTVKKTIFSIKVYVTLLDYLKFLRSLS